MTFFLRHVGGHSGLFQNFETETKSVEALTNDSWVKTSQAISDQFQNDAVDVIPLYISLNESTGIAPSAFINYWPLWKEDDAACEEGTKLANILGKYHTQSHFRQFYKVVANDMTVAIQKFNIQEAWIINEEISSKTELKLKLNQHL